jgi:hypothetical protein
VSRLDNPGDTATATPSKRAPRNSRDRLNRQIIAVTDQLRDRPKFGRSRDDLERELAVLCTQREALGPPEGQRESIEAHQLRSRLAKMQKHSTSLPSDQRPVEDLAVRLASPKRRGRTLTRHYS